MRCAHCYGAEWHSACHGHRGPDAWWVPGQPLCRDSQGGDFVVQSWREPFGGFVELRVCLIWARTGGKLPLQGHSQGVAYS